jgi:hypothetical protein
MVMELVRMDLLRKPIQTPLRAHRRDNRDSGTRAARSGRALAPGRNPSSLAMMSPPMFPDG